MSIDRWLGVQARTGTRPRSFPGDEVKNKNKSQKKKKIIELRRRRMIRIVNRNRRKIMARQNERKIYALDIRDEWLLSLSTTVAPSIIQFLWSSGGRGLYECHSDVS